MTVNANLVSLLAVGLGRKFESVVDEAIGFAKEITGVAPPCQIGYVVVVRSGDVTRAAIGGQASLSDKDLADALSQSAAHLLLNGRSTETV